MLYVAAKSYKATKGDELNVAIGAVVEVLQKSDNGWWLVRYDGSMNGAENGALERKKRFFCLLCGLFSIQVFIVVVFH